MLLRNLLLVAVVIMIGCAHSNDTSRVAVPRPANLLIAGEIAAANADAATLYDAIARLRPNWLAVHGVSTLNTGATDYAIVYVDGHRYGDLESLRNIQAFLVANVRYYDVTEAGAMFGVRGGTGGVIDVKMK